MTLFQSSFLFQNSSISMMGSSQTSSILLLNAIIPARRKRSSTGLNAAPQRRVRHRSRMHGKASLDLHQSCRHPLQTAALGHGWISSLHVTSTLCHQTTMHHVWPASQVLDLTPGHATLQTAGLPKLQDLSLQQSATHRAGTCSWMMTQL